VHVAGSALEELIEIVGKRGESLLVLRLAASPATVT